jgi:hypothetical protein
MNTVETHREIFEAEFIVYFVEEPGDVILIQVIPLLKVHLRTFQPQGPKSGELEIVEEMRIENTAKCVVWVLKTE